MASPSTSGSSQAVKGLDWCFRVQSISGSTSVRGFIPHAPFSYPTPMAQRVTPHKQGVTPQSKSQRHTASETSILSHQVFQNLCVYLAFSQSSIIIFYVFLMHKSAKSQWHSATYAYIGYISFAYHTSAFTLRFPILDHEVFMFLQQTTKSHWHSESNSYIASISFFVQPRHFPYVRTVLATFSRSYNIVQESKRPEDFNHLASNYLQVASRKPDPHIQRRCRKTI